MVKSEYHKSGIMPEEDNIMQTYRCKVCGKVFEVEDGVTPVPRKADLRAYVLAGESVEVWKSGLTRFSRNPDSFIVNSSQGGGFKDTWIMLD